MTRHCHAVVAAALIVATTVLTANASGQEAYRVPPPEIREILDAPSPQGVSIDPTGRFLVLIDRPGMPSIEALAQPMVRLAGMRLNPLTNGRHTTTWNARLSLGTLDGTPRPVALPDDGRLGSPSWSPTGDRFVVTRTRRDGIELWCVDAATRAVKQLTGPRLNAVAGAYTWLPDGRSLVCRLVPESRGAQPQPEAVPTGPVVQQNDGKVSPVRTYQDLLTGPDDEALFEYLATSELVTIDAVTGDSRVIGEPDTYWGVSPAPDGRHLLVTRIKQPYSYLVPASSFPTTIDVWTIDGTPVSRIADLPLRDTTPIGGVPVGRRSVRWQPMPGTATLLWAEALDGGDPDTKVGHRDRLMSSAAPFDGEPEELMRIEHRFSGAGFIEGGTHALVTEYDRDRRWTRTWMADMATPNSEARLVWNRSVNDRYADPGRPISTTNRAGKSVSMLVDGGLLLTGRGASKDGDRPFMDHLDLASMTTTRRWTSDEGCYESVSDVLPERNLLIKRHESPTDPPNTYAVDMDSGSQRALTNFKDPAPHLRGVHRELVTYERADGVPLSATLYLPADYEPGTRLPLLVWAYPREFNDPGTAGQVSGSDDRFTWPRGTSHLFMLTQGYAIMDAATMPVIGDPETMNDAFLDQIVAAARAAIDYAVDRGVADPERVGVGGHSYGAFMTANLLAHSDLFRAGVARSGAYNRTLTPFGFQSERRTLWEAPDSYFAISPFMHAHKITEPMLMIHGAIDNNSGTFPLQSKRMYHALKGHGATTRLVVLPHESHGYRARESVMHVLAEMIDWFDEHVKDAEPRDGATTAAVGGGA